MGLFDFLKKKPVLPDPVPSTVSGSKERELTHADKERIMVERVTLEDMRKLTVLPYIWNGAIKKFVAPHGHPFAYMDLVGPNINIAKQELEKLNSLFVSTARISPDVPKRITIPVDKMVFTPQKHFGHTRLMCSPHTFTGEPAEYPASLSFMTDLSNDSVSTHGDLFYGQDGQIKKANVYCWRKNGGFFFYCTTVDDTLVIEKIEHNGEIIYKAPHVLAWEAKRAQEEDDYAWIQKNLPDKCPKTITGYRRMKTQNTKNFQALRQAAADIGRDI